MNKEHITNVREIGSSFLRLKEKTVLSDISQFSLFKWLNISAGVGQTFYISWAQFSP